MPDVAVRLEHRVGTGERVDHARVLHVRPLPHYDAAEVAAQARERADVAAGSDDHVADQARGLVHERGRIDHGHDAVERVAGHQAT